MFFNTPTEEAAQDFELLPPGIYRALIADSEYKSTKRGDGKYMAICFQIVEGKFKDRKVYANYNIENPSEQAQKIGRGQFKRLLTAIGVNEALADVNQAHQKLANKTLYIEVDQETGNDGKARNVVKKMDGAKPASASAAKPVSAKDAAIDGIPF